MPQLPAIEVMQRAFAEKDASFDGTFFVGVKTTGIFCRPVCRAKPARPQNIEFHPTAQAAIKEGFRPCKLCNPLDPIEYPAVVRQLMHLTETTPHILSEQDLHRAGIDATTARRRFKGCFGVTFSQWQRARRMGSAMKQLKDGSSVITAQQTAGYESHSGFRDALAKLSPQTVSSCDAILLVADWISTPLGPMLAIAGDRGILMLDFTEKSGFDGAVLRMKRKLKDCIVTPGKHPHLTQLRSELSEYFAGARRDFTVTLDPHGTEFELRVWNYLRTIPYASTRTYGQQARAIGNASASRAVGAANGRNDISILIPCHRVIGASGNLVGYGGGLERKKWLLRHEQQVDPSTRGNGLFPR